MKSLICAIIVIQCFGGIYCEVTNIVRAKLSYSNQNLSEKNVEMIVRPKKTILSRAEILDFLSAHVTPQKVPKLKYLLDLMSPVELRHIDILIYLLNIYSTASQPLMQSIFEILLEDERNFEKLIQNFQ